MLNSLINGSTTADEASRILNICNACRYCEGHCAVFPAAQLIPVQSVDDNTQANLSYLSHLCHQCGACYQHCQYADPHEFSVNVPSVLATLRTQSFEDLIQPRALKASVTHPLTFNLATTLLFIAGFGFAMAGNGLFAEHSQGFYALMPHTVMASIFSAAAVFVLICWFTSAHAFWRSLDLPSLGKIPSNVFSHAFKDALTLKHLGGGHELGCYEVDEVPSLLKRRSHHLTMIGFMLCFAATSAGTIYHYFLNAPAPYGWLELPKLLGITGGIALALGTIGLLFVSRNTHAVIKGDNTHFGTALTVLLLATSLSGLLLMFAHSTSWQGTLLAVHLGIVLALFVNFACGKFTHGLFRTIALIRYHHRAAEVK